MTRALAHPSQHAPSTSVSRAFRRPRASTTTVCATTNDLKDVAVRVREARKRFTPDGAAAPVTALYGVWLDVKRGTLFMLLGPNGCGKSTLLRTLAGLGTLDSGEADAPERKAFVFQNPDHQVIMPTVGADVGFGLGRNPDMS